MRTGRVAAVALLATLAACGGTREERVRWCPSVEAVAELDRLALPYPGASERVATRLDVVDSACAVDGEDLLVGSVIAVRLGEGKPAGEVRVPYTVVLDSPEGPRDARSDVAVVPAGAVGTTSYFEHRFEGLADQDEVAVRLLYALVADTEMRAELAERRGRP
ncbi:MAG: hypothetical protein ACLFU0_11750 [Alphaproteobacteria bacterium]